VAATRELIGTRPKALLPMRELGLIAVYWFGINAVWGGYEWFGQTQIELIVGRESRGLTMGVVEAIGGLIPILVVPTAGAISDYTRSRFGKRKGYILGGSFFDLLMGLGMGSYLAVDWALMTDTIPLITSGRYMGLANIANSLAGPIGLLIAGPFLIDTFTRAGMIGMGPRAAVAMGIPLLALAAVVLSGVHPRRDPRQPDLTEEPGSSA
jgi:hypothetical protein